MSNSNSKILISVVIPSCNRPDKLNQLLTSFNNFGYFDDKQIEIVVVNNSNLEWPTKEVCLKFPVVYVRKNIQCEGIAFNSGVLSSKGKYVVKTDDDVIVASKEWLYQLQSHFVENSKLGYVAGNVLAVPSISEITNLWENKGGLSKGKESFYFANETLKAKYKFKVWPVKKIATGANNMVPREVYDMIGIYSTFLGGGSPIPHGNSLEFVYRVIKAGYDLKFDSEAIVFHQHPSKSHELAKKMYVYGVGNTAYMLYIFIRNHDVRYLIEGLAGHHLYTFSNCILSLAGKYSLPPQIAIYSFIGSVAGNLQFLIKYPFRNKELYD